MKKTVGLWIDHDRAVIAFIAGRETEVKLIDSNIEKHHRQSGVETPADDVRERELTGHLNNYYNEVISCIRNSDSILILGPGEAKGELKRRLEKNHLGGRISAIETADKMTDHQIVAHVREHFVIGQPQQQRDKT
jgi:stalled ribosome rescue protein Dom34